MASVSGSSSTTSASTIPSSLVTSSATSTGVGGAASSVTGLASGIDTTALVNSLVAQMKQPEVAWTAQISANGARKSALDTLAQDLTALGAAANALTYGAGFNTYAVTANGTDASGRAVVAATSTSAASAGTYGVSVQQLAQAQKTVGSVALASSTSALGVTGGLTLTTGAGKAITVNVASTDTLASIRDSLNLVQSQTGVQASIVSANPDGSGAHLVLTASASGQAGGFTLADASGTSPSLMTTLGLGAPTVAAQDAKLTVDGVAITRPSNTVSDAIGGVSLVLGAVGSSTVTLTRQPDKAQANVQAFVDSYNAVQKFIKTQNTVQADGTWPPLHNDPSLRDAQSQLTTAMLANAAAPAPNAAPPAFPTLATAGVSLQADGSMTLDATAFQKALQASPSDLSALFTDRMSAVSTYATSTALPTIGTIAQRESSIDGQSAKLQSRIDTLDSRVAKQQAALLAQYAKFETALSQLQATGTALSTQFTALTQSRTS